MSERLSCKLGFFFSLCFSLLIFFYLYGWPFLNPAEISWMSHGDPSQHFFGFNFFLSESWHWPLGQIEHFNWPFGTSLVYTDSIPLIAIPLKLFFKNQVFQFHGIWVLMCFLLQGGVGFLFLFRAYPMPGFAFLGSILLTLFPSFLFRGFDPSRHYSCLAHFLILPAIWLAIDAFQMKSEQKMRLKFWFVLLSLCLGIHFYFFFLNALIFLVAERNLFSSRRGHIRLVSFGAIFVFLMFVFGYFAISIGRSFDGGFASYSMNLFSWFNPEGYSWTGYRLPSVSGDQREGFQYLGLGTLFLVIAIFAQDKNKVKLLGDIRSLQKTPFLLLISFLFLFALSIRLSVLSFALPDFLTAPLYFFIFYLLFLKLNFSKIKSSLASAAVLFLFIFSGHLLRSSGRAGWYVSYFLIFVLFSLKPSRVILGIAILLQCLDVAPMLASIRAENQALLLDHRSSEIAQKFTEAGLENFLGKRDGLNLLSLSSIEQAPVAEFALSHHLKLGPVYVARGQIKRTHPWTEMEKQKISQDQLKIDEVVVTTDPELMNTLVSHPKLATLKIGNYLWIKAAEKN